MLKRIVVAAALVAIPAGAEEAKSLRREVLENGAVVIVKEDHNMPVVTLQAWFPVGSTTEGENLGQGLSHYVEHMIFKGTEKQAPGDFARQVKAGGGDLNAYTSFDKTVFHCTVRSQHFDRMLESFSDVIVNSKMDPEEARKEQQVIVNELKVYLDDPNRLIQYAYNETAWRLHPARHPIGGYLDQFLKLKAEDVGHYFRRWYVPNNMIFICVGDVDGAAAAAAIRRTFASWERKAIPPIVLPVEPPQSAPRRERRSYPIPKGGASSGARLKIGWPTVNCYHEDAPALDMAGLVLAYGDSSRLTRGLKNEKRIVQSLFARSDTPAYRGNFAITATLEPKFMEAAEAAILEEVKKLQEAPVTGAELARVRAAVMAWNVIGRQDIMSQADVCGEGEMYHGNPGYESLYLEKLKAVTPEDILRVARTWMLPSTMTVASVVPREEAGEASRPGPVTAAAFEPHIEEFTLENGLRVVFRRNPNAPSFAFTMTFMAGSRLEEAGKPGVANLAGEMLLRGTTNRSAAQLAEEINATGGTFKVQGGRNTVLLNAEMLTQDFAKALELAADVLMNPAFDAGELDNIKRLALAQLDSTMRSARGATTLRLLKAMYGEHPYGRFPLGTEESIRAISPGDLRAFHGRFVHAGNGVIAVVGNLEPAAVKAALAKALGGLRKSDEKLPAVAPPGELKSGWSGDVNDPTKNMGVALLGFPTVAMHEADRWPLQVIEKVMGGMGGRVWDAVREKRNLAYNAWASNLTMYERGYFEFGAQVQLDNLDPTVKVLKEEIRRIREEEVTAEELVRAKNGVIGELLIDLQKNSAQSQQLALDTIYGLGPKFVFDAPSKVERLTAADIQAAARKYLDPDRAVIAITRPGK
ncbi:MAG: pitrilysin family protein [Planctomycetota bacterium]